MAALWTEACLTFPSPPVTAYRHKPPTLIYRLVNVFQNPDRQMRRSCRQAVPADCPALPAPQRRHRPGPAPAHPPRPRGSPPRRDIPTLTTPAELSRLGSSGFHRHHHDPFHQAVSIWQQRRVLYGE
jgi:hypothetical protein